MMKVDAILHIITIKILIASIHILDREVVQTQLDQLAASLSLNENAKFIHRPHFQLKTSSTLKTIFKVQICCSNESTAIILKHVK